MPPSSSRPATFAIHLLDAAAKIVAALEAGEKISRRLMNASMVEAFGTGAADGAWSQRDSSQMVEVALLSWLSTKSMQFDPAEALADLNAIEARLPTQTVRSEEQVSLQHFSTPISLAWLAARLADIQVDDVILEPSAGTRALAIWAGT